jgi:hypothetical protein
MQRLGIPLFEKKILKQKLFRSHCPKEANPHNEELSEVKVP